MASVNNWKIFGVLIGPQDLRSPPNKLKIWRGGTPPPSTDFIAGQYFRINCFGKVPSSFRPASTVGQPPESCGPFALVITGRDSESCSLLLLYDLRCSTRVAPAPASGEIVGQHSFPQGSESESHFEAQQLEVCITVSRRPIREPTSQFSPSQILVLS